MPQNREPPAYMEYAASMMARIEYRIMTLSQRGLMDSMRRECWVNHAVPADPSLLAKVLGFPSEEVTAALPAVMPFFTEIGGRLICPELEDYRSHLNGIRERQSAGGKQGAAITNGKSKPSKRKSRSGSTGNTTTNPATTSQVEAELTRESLVKSSSDKSSSVKPLSLGTDDLPQDHKAWSNDYERASNGY